MGYLPPPPPKPTWVREAVTCFTSDAERSFVVDTGDTAAAVDFVRMHLLPEGNWRYEANRLGGRITRVDMRREQLPKRQNSCGYCGRCRTSENSTCDGCGAPTRAEN